MPTSDEDLQKQAERVNKLREQVANEEAKRTQREREVANEVTMTQLKAEEAALEARLQVAKEAGKVSVVKQGMESTLEAEKERLRAAVASRDAVKESGPAAARSTESAETGASAETAAATGGAKTGKDK